jgi:alpha-D-ribose 1-methylphosphonate 5-triphosphate synthase subunit PhnL
LLLLLLKHRVVGNGILRLIQIAVVKIGQYLSLLTARARRIAAIAARAIAGISGWLREIQRRMMVVVMIELASGRVLAIRNRKIRLTKMQYVRLVYGLV